MNRKEFLIELTGYYGMFPNENIAEHFARIIKKISENDLQKLLDWFFENIPSSWKIDVSTLTKGINSCTIFFQEEKKSCPICSSPNKEASKFCCNCGYDFSIPADKYKETLADTDTIKQTLRNVFTKLDNLKYKDCKTCKHHVFIMAHQQYECLRQGMGCRWEKK